MQKTRRLRGQAAMEYLMTYSWSILVVMLVGIAMWQLGIFNLGSGASSTYSGFPRIKPQLTLVSVTTEGNFSGYFTNGAGGSIMLSNVSGGCDSFSYSSESISSGKNFIVRGSGCNISGVTGDPYALSIYIAYTVSAAGSTAEHRDYGLLRGPLE
ncbi:MAG: hypothetical protein ABH834_03385 [Candidatus Altiarchaeota archaeon]